jgi:hypothetical protein
LTVRILTLNIVLLAAVVLAVSRLWLFLGEPPPALPAINAVTTTPAPEQIAREQDAEVAESRPEVYDVIVARDMFSPARGVVPPAPAAAIKPPPKALPAPKVTLYGVVIIDGEKTAYLQEGTQEVRPRKVRENENFAGGVLKTIRPDGVTFLFSGSEINVPLRTPKDGAGASSPRGQGAVGVVPRAEAPVAFPRRQTPPGIQQGQMPVPGRTSGTAPRMPGVGPMIPGVAPPAGPGGEVFEDEELPEEFSPEEEVQDLSEDEAGE